MTEFEKHFFCTNNLDSEMRREMAALVGKPFSFMNRLKMKGIGSGRLEITSASKQLFPTLGHAQERHFLSVELRPQGIIIYWRNSINDYAWVVPYYKLSIYHTEVLSFHAMGEFLKITPSTNAPLSPTFLSKLLDQKQSYLA